MKTYYDTSVVVASLVDFHEHHQEAFHAVCQITRGETEGVICAHGLAECFSVLTGTRTYRQIVSPVEIGLTLRENTVGRFEIVALTTEDYLEVVRQSSESGVMGGQIYDALHLAAARKAGCDVIYTFNVRHFRELAPDLATRIRAPQLP
jgi:predicted nucleic acid-binding protein